MIESIDHAELLGLVGLAFRLRLPREWLDAEARAGRLPCLRVGRRLLFNPAAVREALARRAATSTAAAAPDGAGRAVLTPAVADGAAADGRR